MIPIKTISRKPILTMTLLFAGATFLLSAFMMNMAYAGPSGPSGCLGTDHLCQVTVIGCNGIVNTDSTCCPFIKGCGAQITKALRNSDNDIICILGIRAICI